MLYEILKTSKLGASFAPDMYTALWAQKLARDGEVKTLSGAPPLSFQANGTPLLDYLISGNTVQNGTPTPDNPVIPQGTGERTGNLFDRSNPNIFKGYYNTNTNSLVGNPNNAFIYIPLIQGRKYYVYGCKRYNASVTLRWVTTSSTPLGGVSCVRTGTFAQTDIFTITAETNENYLAIFICGDSDYSAYGTVESAVASNCINLVIDNGYKIPISSAGQTTPVYLGEVESTRRIKKLVLTGDENITLHSVKNGIVGVRIPTSANVKGASEVICTHCNGNTWTAYNDGNRPYSIIVSNPADGNAVLYMTAPDSEHNTLETFIQWVTNQYNNGTPIEIWYVQQTETTAIVNEPLMKIGDYADTVSMEQAGVEIPTTRGTNTLDVLTDVKPSEIYIKYKS